MNWTQSVPEGLLAVTVCPRTPAWPDITIQCPFAGNGRRHPQSSTAILSDADVAKDRHEIAAESGFGL